MLSIINKEKSLLLKFVKIWIWFWVFVTREICRLSSRDVDKFLEIDTVLISSRHLYRMPYSLHEKSGLVSVPINPKNVLKFEKKDAIPANVKVEYQFLNREIIEPSAKRLLLQALDYKFKTKEEDKPKNFDEIQIKNPIKQELIPAINCAGTMSTFGNFLTIIIKIS